MILADYLLVQVAYPSRTPVPRTPRLTFCQILGLVLLLSVVLSACGDDPADQAYDRALAGEEDGSTLEERLAHIDRAIELAPERTPYYQLRALLRMSACRMREAIVDLDRAIESAGRPYLRYLRGLVYCEIAECTRALGDFDTAIAAQPDNLQFYRGRSLARSATGDGAGALADAERLIAAAPHGHWLYARGVAYATLGRDVLAVRDFDAALRKRPELVYAVQARASSYERLGQPEKAAADREQADRLTRWAGSCAYRLSPFHY